MARYQSLPDRIDTFTTTISDQAMCLNYGLVIECCTVQSSGKNQLNVFNTSCSWTVPPGVYSIYIEMWGAGGGGGGGGAAATNNNGQGGGGGSYISATVATAPGCVYAVCGGAPGCYGCCATGSTAGSPSYVTGFNTSMCAPGGAAGLYSCYGANGCVAPFPCIKTTVYANNTLGAVGSPGIQTMTSSGAGVYTQSWGGSSPFNGGAGGYRWTCSSGQQSGVFPGGGGAGSTQSATAGTCGDCGASGLVRIWY